MDNELVTLIWSIVGAVTSLLVEVIPGLKETWNDLKWKPLIMLGLALGVPMVLWALSCYGGMAIVDVGCEWQGAVNMLVAGFTAFLVNQTTFAVVSRNTVNAQARVEASGCKCN